MQPKQDLKIEQTLISSLVPSSWNPNIVSPDNEEKLRNSLQRHGFFKPALARELPDGSLEIVGGEHRVMAAKSIGYTHVPVVNLGKISDEKAKELCLLDNGRFGNDDTLQLAALLSSLDSIEDLSSFMPYSDADFQSIFSSTSIALDELDIPDDEPHAPSLAKEKTVQTHQIMRFKVPVGDVASITTAIERTMKTQRFNDEDSLSNAGNALVHIFTNDLK